MHAAKACLLALGLTSLLACGSYTYNAPPAGTASGPTQVQPTPAGPSIVAISPSSAPAGSPDVQLDVEGAKFPADPTSMGDHAGIFWGPAGGTGTYLTVTNANETHLTATIPASLLIKVETVTVQVQVYHFADDSPKAASNTVTFTVTK